MPSNADYLNLINAVANRSSPPSGWALLQPGTTSINTGFEANAYYNTSTGQIVLVFYGPSMTTNPGAFGTDLELERDGVWLNRFVLFKMLCF